MTTPTLAVPVAGAPPGGPATVTGGARGEMSARTAAGAGPLTTEAPSFDTILSLLTPAPRPQESLASCSEEDEAVAEAEEDFSTEADPSSAPQTPVHMAVAAPVASTPRVEAAPLPVETSTPRVEAAPLPVETSAQPVEVASPRLDTPAQPAPPAVSGMATSPSQAAQSAPVATASAATAPGIASPAAYPASQGDARPAQASSATVLPVAPMPAAPVASQGSVPSLPPAFGGDSAPSASADNATKAEAVASSPDAPRTDEQAPAPSSRPREAADRVNALPLRSGAEAVSPQVEVADAPQVFDPVSVPVEGEAAKAAEASAKTPVTEREIPAADGEPVPAQSAANTSPAAPVAKAARALPGDAPEPAMATPPVRESAPVEAAPVEAAPVESAPVEAAPVEAAPVEAAPVEDAPVAAAVSSKTLGASPADPKQPAAESVAGAALPVGVTVTAEAPDAQPVADRTAVTFAPVDTVAANAGADAPVAFTPVNPVAPAVDPAPVGDADVAVSGDGVSEMHGARGSAAPAAQPAPAAVPAQAIVPASTTAPAPVAVGATAAAPVPAVAPAPAAVPAPAVTQQAVVEANLERAQADGVAVRRTSGRRSAPAGRKAAAPVAATAAAVAAAPSMARAAALPEAAASTFAVFSAVAGAPVQVGGEAPVAAAVGSAAPAPSAEASNTDSPADTAIFPEGNAAPSAEAVTSPAGKSGQAGVAPATMPLPAMPTVNPISAAVAAPASIEPLGAMASVDSPDGPALPESDRQAAVDDAALPVEAPAPMAIPVAAAAAPAVATVTPEGKVPALEAHLRQMPATPGNHSISLRLAPESLGDITVRITTLSNGDVRASVVARTAEAKHILESSVEGLRQTLSDRGLHLQNFAVNVDSGSGQNPTGGDARPSFAWGQSAFAGGGNGNAGQNGSGRSFVPSFGGDNSVDTGFVPAMAVSGAPAGRVDILA